RRIVLLGKAGAGKDRLVRLILGDTKLKEECEECSVYEGEHAGRKVCIVDAPGWDSTSIDKTAKKIKNEITQSVTLCAPGPHALILVLSINTDDLPSVNELKSAWQHMELLSERVWNYTMVLFLCDGDVEESTMNDNIQNAEKLLQKCRGRHYVMRQKNLETEVNEFLKEIDSMVEKNIRNSKVKESSDFFLPQVYYDIMQSKMPDNEDPQKNTDKRQNEDKSEGTDVLRRRRGSLQEIKPNKRRIVLLGKAGAGKDRLVRLILGDTKLKEECEECSVYEGEHAGRKVCIVDAPGWDSTSIDKTAKKIKNEITRSMTLCAPGPHALILVLSINTDDLPSVNELKSAWQHMELLSERVWNYTMVLFLCDGDVEESTMNDHIQNAEKLLQKCRGRHYVMRQKNLETEVNEFLKEIDSMVEENIRNSKVKESSDFFLPQVYYDIMQSKMPDNEDPQKNTDKRQNEDKSEGTVVLRRRRGSLQEIKPNKEIHDEEETDKLKHRRGSLSALPPNMTKRTEDSVGHTDETEAPKSKNPDQLRQSLYIKPVVVIVMAIMGALIGSVVGGPYGTVWA
ncbi:GTPase IMAP family member 4-like, partial [Clarias magur]